MTVPSLDATLHYVTEFASATNTILAIERAKSKMKLADSDREALRETAQLLKVMDLDGKVTALPDVRYRATNCRPTFYRALEHLTQQSPHDYFTQMSDALDGLANGRKPNVTVLNDVEKMLTYVKKEYRIQMNLGHGTI